MATSHPDMARHGRTVAIIGLLGVSQFLVACQSREATVDLAAEKLAIQQTSVAFSNAETSGKADSALTFMWDNAVLQPPDGPQIEGRDAVRAFYAPVTLSPAPADSTHPRSARTILISASGDLATEWGPGAIVVNLPNGRQLVRFKFLIVWERRGDIWKVCFNSWSGSTPAAAQ